MLEIPAPAAGISSILFRSDYFSRNIDIVVGGHSHTFLDDVKFRKNLDGKSIGNDQNGKSGIYVGKLVIDMKKK